MNSTIEASLSGATRPPSREHIVHALYEAAELEHNLMCTYLYAAFSLKAPDDPSLDATEAAAVGRWRRIILDVAKDEMSHLTAVWNITAALGAAPRVGRTNFPLDPGYLPAGVVVKLAPFSEAVLQHFIHLERPEGSSEPDGAGFAPERQFTRAVAASTLTPIGPDYETVGHFYALLGQGLRALVDRVGESAAFNGDPLLQLSPAETSLTGAREVVCLKTAIAAFDAIIAQGEGATSETEDSHFQKFRAVRQEFLALKQRNPAFVPAYPAAHNPVFRRPPRPEGRVWIEDPEAAAVVDLANASYGLMLRLLAFAYAVPRPDPDKGIAVDLAVGLMRAVTPLAEVAARLPAGPSNPGCNAGMSFLTLRDAASLPPGRAAWAFLVERFDELVETADALSAGNRDGISRAARVLQDLARRAKIAATASAARIAAAPIETPRATVRPAEVVPSASGGDGVEIVESDGLALHFEAKRCIHARFCVTGAPQVFLANVEGPWIHPEAMDSEELAAIARECPSGAIRYQRKDGRPNEAAPPVNLLAVREAGPYAVRAQIHLDGVAAGYRATLCRCGASKNKPFCDGSHHDVGFAASGEPVAGATEMLAVRDGPLMVDPQVDGPLQLRGNLEITSGTGRVVARVQSARLCRCGASGTKPFCDGSHEKIGFRSV